MIHSSSVVENGAKIGKNVQIGPFCYIGPQSQIDDNVELVSNVHIEGNTKIGKGTKIFPFSSIGTQPQDLKFKGEHNSLEIGENNTIREYVTINPGTKGGGGKTVIGNNCLLMISSHVAHDCKIGNDVVIANNVPLGGHVTIEDSVVIGGNSAVQQFTRIGRLAMIGGMTGVLKDVIPFGLSLGNRNIDYSDQQQVASIVKKFTQPYARTDETHDQELFKEIPINSLFLYIPRKRAFNCCIV